MIEIREATSESDMEDAASLFRSYVAELGVALDFQGFELELSNLPGKYAPPLGSLFLAVEGERTIGCVAHRLLDKDICEMKRLYVSPDGRGQELGKKLSEKVMELAKLQGYKRMRLDTLERLIPALRLYKHLGFYEIDAYYKNPLAGVVYLEKEL